MSRGLERVSPPPLRHRSGRVTAGRAARRVHDRPQMGGGDPTWEDHRSHHGYPREVYCKYQPKYMCKLCQGRINHESKECLWIVSFVSVLLRKLDEDFVSRGTHGRKRRDPSELLFLHRMLTSIPPFISQTCAVNTPCYMSCPNPSPVAKLHDAVGAVRPLGDVCPLHLYGYTVMLLLIEKGRNTKQM